MLSPDTVNGVFEFGGSIFTWMNVRRVVLDRGYAGVYVPGIVFFAGWGLWNLFYYPFLHQWVSFLGGLSIVLSNLAWVTALLWFGRKA